MQDKLNSPVFITGIERSGSSIIARILNICGAFSGEVTAMQENIEMNKLVDTYYNLIGADLKGQNPLPKTDQLLIPTNWKAKVSDVLCEEKYDKIQLWMYKGSRLCQIWPVWHYSFPNTKWIIVRRRTGDIIDSCLKTGYMVAYKDKEGWLGWVHQHEKLFVEMIETGLNCKVIWPERMVTGDYQQIYEMLDWLGLEWNKNIVGLIEPLLYKSRQQKERSKI